MSRARARARALGLPLPAADLAQLRAKVRALAENRPGTYRMVDATGAILYVGKAKRVRTRLLSYFRAEYPAEKASRILHAAHDIVWDYAPSEFSAYLAELRQIRRYRPRFNVTLNRTRRSVLIKIGGGLAPRVYVGAGVVPGDLRAYGPFRSLGRTIEAVRTLNDLLQLRDCADKMPIAFAGQGDLFGEPTRRAACARYELGFCSGPCGGFVAEWDYRRRLDTAMAFLEGRTIQPIDRTVSAMTEAAAAAQFETATRWRDRFEQLEWLLAATSRARSAIDLLTFVYRDPGAFGDDRAFVIHRGVVRAAFPYPATPIEHEAFKAVVAEAAAATDEPAWPLPLDSIDEILLVMAWFRKHPEALRRTTPYAHWAT